VTSSSLGEDLKKRDLSPVSCETAEDQPLPLSTAIVTIVGMGLMGGSLGKALVKVGACKEVRALVRREKAAEEIVAIGAAHSAGTDPERILEPADLVVLATPVRTIEHQVSEIHRFVKADSVITDMGSVKTGVVKAMDSLPMSIRAIGGHPMCGKETSGLAAAEPELFRNKVWVLTPSKNTDAGAMLLVQAMIKAVGARQIFMDAEAHDIVVSCVSHLPYVLAATLIGVAEDTAGERPEIWKLAAGGFRDTSRVASSDLTMMIDILAANRNNIVNMLGLASSRIGRIAQLMIDSNEDGLRDMLGQIRDRRIGMFQTG